MCLLGTAGTTAMGEIAMGKKGPWSRETSMLLIGELQCHRHAQRQEAWSYLIYKLVEYIHLMTAKVSVAYWNGGGEHILVVVEVKTHPTVTKHRNKFQNTT
jgi:hypothetical protein